MASVLSALIFLWYQWFGSDEITRPELQVSYNNLKNDSNTVNFEWNINSHITPLVTAAMRGYLEEAERILQDAKSSGTLGDRINEKDQEGMTPLHWASLRGHVQLIRKLLQFGADVHSLDHANNTALHLSALSDNPMATQFLLRSGSFVNAQNSNGDTALHLAAWKGNFDLVATLLSHGALVNITDSAGRNVLDLAEEGKSIEITKLLKSVGASSTGTSRIDDEAKAVNKSCSGLDVLTIKRCIEKVEELIDKYGHIPIEELEESNGAQLYRWEDGVFGPNKIPPDAVIGGTDLLFPVYVGRVTHGQYIIPAKACPIKHLAYYSYDGHEYYTTKYQILCSERVIWKPVRNGHVPPEAFVAGKTDLGEDLLVGRDFVEFNGKQYLTPGKVLSWNESLHISFHYKVYETTNYEVLIIQ